MRVRWILTAALAVCSASCAARGEYAASADVHVTAAPSGESAGGEAYDQEEPEASDPSSAEIEQLSTDVEALSSAADCGGACAAGQRLCELRERICDVAARDPDDGELHDRCEDASLRCDRARSRLALACGCAVEP